MAFPTEHAWREYQVFLRGPVGLNTFAFGTVDATISGVPHVGRIIGFPAPADNTTDDFGIQSGGGFTVEIADEDAIGGIDGQGPDWYLLQEDLTHILLEDGSGALIMEY